MEEEGEDSNFIVYIIIIIMIILMFFIFRNSISNLFNRLISLLY